MGRSPCCDKANVKKGPWSPEEDNKLKQFIEKNGTGGNWIALPQKAGLKRCGKSCRLRWLNYLRPNLKHGEFSEEEDTIICSLVANIGTRWSIIAGQLPGRTDNDIKNYWNTKLKKKLMGMEVLLQSQRIMSTPFQSSHDKSTYPSQYFPSAMWKHHNSNQHCDSSTVSLPLLEAIAAPSSYSNAMTCYLDQGVSLYGSMQIHHCYPAVKESLFMFGSEGNAYSSSGGSCSQIHHGREIKQEDELSYDHQNRIISTAVEANQNHSLLNHGIDDNLNGYYDPEVLKQLIISSTSTDNNTRFSSIFLS